MIDSVLQTYRNKPGLYEKLGRLEKWYTERLDEIGTNWCLEFADGLIKYLETRNYLVFISPTANLGIYEKAIFVQLAKKFCVEMHISDHAKINFAVSNDEITNSFGTSKFINDGVCDAKKLTINCDVIYDIKGAVWHEKGKSFKTLIGSYYGILNSNGLLIIDSTPKVNIVCVCVNNFLYSVKRCFRIGRRRIRIERSTLQLLKKRGKESVLLKYFEYQGDIQTEKVGFAVYKKRSLIKE